MDNIRIGTGCRYYSTILHWQDSNRERLILSIFFFWLAVSVIFYLMQLSIPLQQIKRPKAYIYIRYIYNVPEPSVIYDPLVTQGSPLCSRADARFVPLLAFGSLVLALNSLLLPLYSPILPPCSPIFPLCSLVLPLYSPCSLSLLLPTPPPPFTSVSPLNDCDL